MKTFSSNRINNHIYFVFQEMDNGPHGRALLVPRHVDLMEYKQKPELALIHLLPAAVMHAMGHRQKP